MKKISTLLLSLVFCTSAFSFDTMWMSRVVKKHTCIDALGAVVASQETCKSWSMREAAEPFVDKASDRIFVGGTDGFLHVVEPNKGRTIKRKTLTGNLVSGIVAHDTNLIFGTDRGLAMALDVNSLEQKWATELDSGILQTPVLIGDNLLFVTQLGTIYAISVKTGEKVWTKKRELPNRIFFRHLSLPVFSPTTINGNLRDAYVVGHPNGKLEFVDVKDGETLDAVQMGSLKEPWADVVTTPVVAEGLLFAASYNSGIVAFDSSSRSRKWELKEKGISQMVLSKGILVVAGTKFVMATDAITGKVVWKFTYDKGSPGSILIRDNEVYVTSDTDGLYILDFMTGRPKQVLGSGSGFAGGVKNFDEHLLAMSSAGALFFFSRNDMVVSARKSALKR